MKNLRTSLDVEKQSFLFSGDSTWRRVTKVYDKDEYSNYKDKTLRYSLSPNGIGLDHLLFGFFLPLTGVVTLYSKIVVSLHQRSKNGMIRKVAARSKSKSKRMLIITRRTGVCPSPWPFRSSRLAKIFWRFQQCLI